MVATGAYFRQADAPKTMDEISAKNQEELDEVLSKFDGNAVINGDMRINQRGAASYTANDFTLDQFRLISGTGATNTISQAAGIAVEQEFSLSWDRSVAGSSVSVLDHFIEDVHLLAGRTVTLSYYAKSNTGGDVIVGNQLSQFFGSGGSAIVNNTLASNTITPTLQRYTDTVTLASVVGKTINAGHYTRIRFLRNHANQDGEIFIGGVKLEIGAVATPFRSRPQALELFLCQRYYQRVNLGWGGFAIGTTQVSLQGTFPAEMRVAPTLSLLDTSLFLRLADNTTNTSSGSTITFSRISSKGLRLTLDGFVGLTAQLLVTPDQAGPDWLELDAELA